MRINLPEQVQTIIGRLEAHGYEAYAVGGCVRDACLGREPHDWDITTSARPEQVRALFSHTFDTGIAHGTITVLLGRAGYEVTTFRIDGAYEDARHPSSVTFTRTLTEDLKRRDFTINAMAYNDRVGLVDCFGGLTDLAQRTIRCVGDAKERFSEDALRILRAVRFGAQLDFAIEEATEAAAKQLAPTLAKISAERIHAELEKMITSSHPERIAQAYDLGITKVILPEFDALMTLPQNSSHHIYTAGRHTIEAMRAIPPDRMLRFTMLFHDLGKREVATVDEAGIYHFKHHAEASARIAKKVMRRLKFDNASMQTILRLVACHSVYPEESETGVRQAVWEIGPDLFAQFLLVKRADTMGQSPAMWERKLGYLSRVQALYDTIASRGDCLSLKALAVTGNDLIAAGEKPGREIGEILSRMLQEVLQCPQDNQKDVLLTRLREGRYRSVAKYQEEEIRELDPHGFG